MRNPVWPGLFILALLPLSVMTEAFANAAPLELSFEDAIRMAETKPASVIMSHERVQQALARLGETRSALFPQLSAGASQTRRTVNLEAQGIAIPGMSPLDGPFNTFDARLKLTQALFDAETIEGLRLAKAGHALALEQERKARQDSMALVATLYVNAKRDQEGVALGTALVNRDQKELALASNQLKLGTGSQDAADQAGARLADSQRILAANRADAETSRLDLVAALDLPVDQPIIFKDTPPFPPPAGLDQAASADLESHPDIGVARETLSQNEAQAGVIKAGYFPKISTEADYGESGGLPSGSLATYTYGGELSLPIFEGGSRQKRSEEAHHQILESQAGLADAREQTRAKAQIAAEAVQKSWAAVQSRQTALSIEDKELALSRQKFHLGVGTDMEQIEEGTQEAQIRDNFDDAVATYQVARVSLAQALGNMESLITEKP